MLQKVKNWINGNMLMSGDYPTLSDAMAAWVANHANLSGAELSGANLSGANLSGANLSRANLSGADLSGAKNMTKIMGVEPGNFYWKKINSGLVNEKFKYRIGVNVLSELEKFADDERVLCSYPGFHFASKSWCKTNYPNRPYLAKIRIPLDAKINEPWGTDGKASADKIEILQVFDKAGNDVTKQFEMVAEV